MCTHIHTHTCTHSYIHNIIHTRTATQTVIELEEPLDLGASRDLLTAFNKYGDIEKELWEQVGMDLVRGKAPTPSKAKFQETFVLGKLHSDDVLQ